ncbi:hypothetical protein HKD37_16G045717 [Glycine soja]
MSQVHMIGRCSYCFPLALSFGCLLPLGQTIGDDVSALESSTSVYGSDDDEYAPNAEIFILLEQFSNKMQGIRRMDAALDAMRPLGFRTQLILRTVNELLDVGWREKKLVNTKGMLRAAGILEHHSKGILDFDKPRKLLADFRIGKLITGNIHRLQVMCLIKCQDDIFGHVIRKKFSDKFPGITCTCRTNGGWSD